MKTTETQLYCPELDLWLWEQAVIVDREEYDETVWHMIVGRERCKRCGEKHTRIVVAPLPSDSAESR